MKSPVLRWAAFLFALFHIYCNVFASISELWLSAIHFGGFCAICALMANEPEAVSRTSAGYWLNVGLAVTGIAASAYLLLFEDALYARETEFILSDFVFATVAVVLAIEFTRRTTGWFMPILILISLAYILFLGRYMPGLFSFPGLSLETVLYRSYFTSEGMFGLTAQISSTFVFMFIIFGSFMLHSGAGDFIVRLARCLAGRGADATGDGCGRFRTRQLHADFLPDDHRRLYVARHSLLPHGLLFRAHRSAAPESAALRYRGIGEGQRRAERGLALRYPTGGSGRLEPGL